MGTIGHDKGIINHLVSKKDVWVKFLAVVMVQNLEKVRYTDLKIYTHNCYVNGKDCWLKTLLAALDVLVKW